MASIAVVYYLTESLKTSFVTQQMHGTQQMIMIQSNSHILGKSFIMVLFPHSIASIYDRFQATSTFEEQLIGTGNTAKDTGMSSGHSPLILSLILFY